MGRAKEKRTTFDGVMCRSLFLAITFNSSSFFEEACCNHTHHTRVQHTGNHEPQLTNVTSSCHKEEERNLKSVETCRRLSPVKIMSPDIDRIPRGSYEIWPAHARLIRFTQNRKTSQFNRFKPFGITILNVSGHC